MICQHCQTEFTPKPWPATRSKYCSSKCNKGAWAARNVEGVRESWKKYQRNHRDRRLASQRKYNNSTKGQLMKARWSFAHNPQRAKNYLELYHNDDYVRAVHISRELARKKLIESGRDYICGMCDKRERLHCHHINEDPMYNELSNLAWLCHLHHGIIHSDPLGLDDQTKRNIQDFRRKHHIS